MSTIKPDEFLQEYTLITCLKYKAEMPNLWHLKVELLTSTT